MVEVVEATTCLAAWKTGAKHIMERGDIFDLITVVQEPTANEQRWLCDYSPREVDHQAPSLSDVITTIFPYKYLNDGLPRFEIYDRYLAAHERAKRIHGNARRKWGTYFQRMISFGPNRLNQLERVIGSLSKWSNNPKAALTMHLSSPDLDNPKPLGSPCLQYTAFLCPDKDHIQMLAVYRNHDYFGRVLGNLIGLGYLLRFVADEVGRQPGALVCHSAHAFNGATKGKLRRLVQDGSK